MGWLAGYPVGMAKVCSHVIMQHLDNILMIPCSSAESVQLEVWSSVLITQPHVKLRLFQPLLFTCYVLIQMFLENPNYLWLTLFNKVSPTPFHFQPLIKIALLHELLYFNKDYWYTLSYGRDIIIFWTIRMEIFHTSFYAIKIAFFSLCR